MKFTCGLTFTLPLVLVLLMVVATKGHTELSCYVCDNCGKIDTKKIPVERCGGENVHMMSTTTTSTSMSPSTSMSSSSEESISTTTSRPSTPMPNSDSTTTNRSAGDPITTNTTTTTIEFSTPATSSTTSDDRNASTSNATSSTPQPSVFVTPSLESFNIDAETGFPFGNETWFIPSGINDTEGSHNRQRRHTEINGITYYCYSIQKRYDNVFGTKRGCIGVKTELKVCDQLNMDNNNQTKKCSTCMEKMCNGSSALGVSIATLLIALLAVIYKV